MIWFVVILGIFNIVMSFVMQTKNFESALIFKVIPFIFGSGSIIYCLSYFGII